MQLRAVPRATVPNPLGVFLCHEHACEAMGEALHVLINCCMHEIVLLHCRPRGEVEGVFFMPAQELTAQLGTARNPHRPRRRPAMPPCAGVAPVAP